MHDSCNCCRSCSYVCQAILWQAGCANFSTLCLVGDLHKVGNDRTGRWRDLSVGTLLKQWWPCKGISATDSFFHDTQTNNSIFCCLKEAGKSKAHATHRNSYSAFQSQIGRKIQRKYSCFLSIWQDLFSFKMSLMVAWHRFTLSHGCPCVVFKCSCLKYTHWGILEYAQGSVVVEVCGVVQNSEHSHSPGLSSISISVVHKRHEADALWHMAAHELSMMGYGAIVSCLQSGRLLVQMLWPVDRSSGLWRRLVHHSSGVCRRVGY